ncbi:VOC family protein [Paenibacillus chitinolyticus]|uniref:VOC family protein n=1 Tax=Paenibacillus chitinolyticus TaxID=79263 RepID=UPI00366E0F01
MKIEHMALWTADLEQMKSFYETYFGAAAGDKYTNVKKQFHSYFLQFESGARLELMTKPACAGREKGQIYLGYAHIAFSTGSEDKVVELTERLRRDGYTVESEPRVTGDGYFESVVLDPEGNSIEITV